MVRVGKRPSRLIAATKFDHKSSNFESKAKKLASGSLAFRQLIETSEFGGWTEVAQALVRKSETDVALIVSTIHTVS